MPEAVLPLSWWQMLPAAIPSTEWGPGSKRPTRSWLRHHRASCSWTRWGRIAQGDWFFPFHYQRWSFLTTGCFPTSACTWEVVRKILLEMRAAPKHKTHIFGHFSKLSRLGGKHSVLERILSMIDKRVIVARHGHPAACCRFINCV